MFPSESLTRGVQFLASCFVVVGAVSGATFLAVKEIEGINSNFVSKCIVENGNQLVHYRIDLIETYTSRTTAEVNQLRLELQRSEALQHAIPLTELDRSITDRTKDVKKLDDHMNALNVQIEQVIERLEGCENYQIAGPPQKFE